LALELHESGSPVQWPRRLKCRKWLGPLALSVGLATLSGGCNDGTGATSPTPPATPSPPPQEWDVSFVESDPPANGVLQLSAPNNTPVSLSVTFSVMVPEGQAGNYNWNTVLQVDLFGDPAFISPGVTTAFQLISLEEGTQLVTIDDFHTTNTTCYNPDTMPATNESLDIDIRKEGASLGQNRPQVYGKRFDVSYTLSCVT